MVLEKKTFEGFYLIEHGGHLGHVTNNVCFNETQMFHIKYDFNPNISEMFFFKLNGRRRLETYKKLKVPDQIM